MIMEGFLIFFVIFVLIIFLENYLIFLLVDGNVVVYSVLILIMLGMIVFSKFYMIEDVVFFFVMSFYVGFGFNVLLDVCVVGLDKVLLVLCIVWVIDSGVYFVGMNYGKCKLVLIVFLNKIFEGVLGGILGVILVIIIFMIVDSIVVFLYGIYKMLVFVIFFSIVG